MTSISAGHKCRQSVIKLASLSLGLGLSSLQKLESVFKNNSGELMGLGTDSKAKGLSFSFFSI